jgi:hypothetical protein
MSEERLELSTNGVKGRAGAHVFHNQGSAILTESVAGCGQRQITNRLLILLQDNYCVPGFSLPKPQH